MNSAGSTILENNLTKMWVDPKKDWKANEGSVLLAEHIRFYVKHGLLIETGFKKENLKGASLCIDS